MIRRHWVLGFALTLFFCLGCVESDKPLSDPATSKIDPDLIGTWVGDEKETYAVTVAGDGFPAGMHRIDFTSEDSKDVVYFFVTKVGDQKFFNLATCQDEPPKPKWRDNTVVFYSFAAYEVGSNSMKYTLLEREFFTTGVKRGELSTRKVKHDDAEYTILTNSTEEIRAFCQKHAKSILSDTSIELRRKK